MSRISKSIEAESRLPVVVASGWGNWEEWKTIANLHSISFGDNKMF